MKQLLVRTIAALALGASTLTAAVPPALADPPPWAPAHGRRDHDRDHRYDRDRYDRGRREIHAYDWNRPDPRYRGYYADHYYRGGYRPIRVTRDMRIYRGYDNRYYCRRSDGTTGLIVGAALGGLLGHSLDRGGSGILGTLLGAGAGGLLGREIDRGDVVCR